MHLQRSRFLRLPAISSILAVALLATGSLTARASDLSQAADQALQFLATQQLSDGSLDHSASETEDWILATVARGKNPNHLVNSSEVSVFDFLTAQITTATSDANRTGKLVQALVASGRNPRNFAGRNLLARLEGPGATSGGFYDPASGAFNVGVTNFDSNASFHQSNAILGLVAAADPSFPVTSAAIAFLKSLQVPSGAGAGAWGAAGHGDANTNSTAIALMALASVHDHSADAAALSFLHTQQDPNSGGFPLSTLGLFGSPTSDPDSDALVIQGLLAAGQDPGGAVWTNARGNAFVDVLRFQDATSGGFFFAPGFTPDAFTTTEIPAALLKAPFPILPS